MDKFDLKKYLAEGKLFEERKDIGTPEELKSFLYSRQSDIVGWVKEAIENHGEENISWEEDIKQWIADDAGEITPAKFQLTYNDTTYDGYDEYMFESVYEEFVQSTYNKFFGKTAEYDENQLELAEGKLLKEEMSLEIGDDHLKLSTDSGYYGGDINDDGTVDFSVVYYGEDDRDGMKFDRSNWKEMLGPDHAFVKISNQIPTEVESVDDYIMVKVDLEDLKGISDSAEGEPLNESSSEERWRELVKVERMIFDDESLMKKIKAGDYRFKADGPLFTRGASGMDRVDISKDGKNLFRISPPNAAKENWSLMLLDVWSGYMSYKRQKDTYEEKGIPEILRRLETLL